MTTMNARLSWAGRVSFAVVALPISSLYARARSLLFGGVWAYVGSCVALV